MNSFSSEIITPSVRTKDGKYFNMLDQIFSYLIKIRRTEISAEKKDKKQEKKNPYFKDIISVHVNTEGGNITSFFIMSGNQAVEVVAGWACFHSRD